MKVLITGATGLVGRRLVKHLLANDYAINFLTTKASKLSSLPNCKGFLWNINNKQIDPNCFKEVVVIIHLAGSSIGKRWSNAYQKEIIDSRVLSANLIFETLKQIENTVEHYISASAIGIYQHSYTTIHNEESCDIGTNFLAKVVSEWEQSANNFSHLGIKVTKLRTGLVLDQELGALPKMVNPIKYGFGAALANGKQKMSWIHIADLVSVYEFVIKNEVVAVINAVAPDVVTNTYFTKSIGSVLHKNIWLPNVPTFMLYLFLGKMSILLTESQNVVPDILCKKSFVFRFPTLKSALKDLL